MSSSTTPTSPQGRFEAIFDPAVRADPYPAFRAAAHAAPFALPEFNMVVFGSYADCDEILRHPDGAVDRRKSTMVRNAIGDGADPADFDTHSFLILDPPDHTRLRKLVQKAFSPRRIRELEPEIATIVDDLLGRVADTGDVVVDLAYPLPVIVICRLLGVPVEDEPRFGHASKLIAQGLDDFLPAVGDLDEGRQERLDAATWMYDYLRELIHQRRSAPRDDLMSALVAAEESGEHLTEDEIVATCELLFVAGHETTVNLIANAALAMLTHPGQWSAAAENPDRMPAVVEETLRWDPPVQLSDRIAERDMIIGDTVVPAGDSAVLLLGAAHRDPAEYDRPDEFDPDRPAFRHLAFGHGAHFCLGAPLARLEAAAALTALTRRFPHAQLAGEPTYRPNVSLRGMSHLPVTLTGKPTTA
ncbi:cytochrome P450 [Mycolicibacterium sp. XJ662]